MQTTKECTNEETQMANEKFMRGFRWWGTGWFIVSLVSVTSTDYTVLHTKPYLFHDWRAGAIFVLSLAIIAVFGLGVAKFHTHTVWPPPLFSSLAVVATLYLMVCGIVFIDMNFVWNLYLVFGVVLSRFTGRRMLLLVTFLLLSFGIFGKIITWPLNLDQMNSLLGLCMSFYGTAAITLVMQKMIGERNQRTRLLEELTKAHSELAAAHRQLANTAAQEQELAVLRERSRLAREMHDTLGHALVLVTVKLEVAQRLRERDPERSNRELAVTQTIVRESMNELRASIANLRSPALEHEPAGHALSRCAREMALRTGMHVIYELQAEGLPEEIEATLWKVGQEAIANVEKHAHAQHMVLRTGRRGENVLLFIEDDGVGFDPHRHKANGRAYSSPEGHYGLSGMVERVERLGGTLHIKAGAERGTVVEVVLPLIATSIQESVGV